MLRRKLLSRNEMSLRVAGLMTEVHAGAQGGLQGRERTRRGVFRGFLMPPDVLIVCMVVECRACGSSTVVTSRKRLDCRTP